MRYLGRLKILLGRPRFWVPLGCRVARAANNCCPNSVLRRACPSTLNLGCPISKSTMTSCCCLLLTIAEPGHLHQDTDYFISLVFLTQMRKKNLYRENILSSEYACCLSTIIHIGDSQFCYNWQLYYIYPSCCWINYGEAHEVNTYIIFTFKSVLTHEVYT